MKRIGALIVLATASVAFAPAAAHAEVTPSVANYPYSYTYGCNADGSMNLNFRLTDNTGQVDKFTEIATVEYQTADGVWHVATYPDGSPDKTTATSGIVAPAVGSHFFQQFDMAPDASYWKAVGAVRYGFRLQGNWFVPNGSGQTKVAWIHGRVIASCAVS